MASKPKHPLNGMHTAGIFSDASIDGPLIGTLVLVVDRAKNLPNRKTIGKQDPYCAARLGKEAKKTTTDIRGGQTPRWDQELRFTVHDSPDYFQLKVSVFNDDKKTDLIGETWIDLRDIIVPGGGQNDLWHQLNCRGKYAGEIRIEITFYDSRPKPEKPAPAAKAARQNAAAGGGDADTASSAAGSTSGPGTAGPRSMPKRRPLPSDPVTGKPPPQVPAAVPASAPSPAPAASSTPSPAPELAQTPQRPQPNSPAAFVPTQSPLQQVEYGAAPHGTPSHRMEQQPPQQYRTPDRADRHSSRHEDRSGYSPSPVYAPPQPSPHEFYDPRASVDGRHGHHDHHDSRSSQDFYDRQQQYDYHDQRSPHDHYDMSHQHDDRGISPEEDDVPPPPPAHRSQNSNGGTISQVYQNGGASYDLVPIKGTPPSMRHDVLRNEAHRKSVSTASYPGRPTFKGYDQGPAGLTVSTSSSPYSNEPSHPSSRHLSYDAGYDSGYDASHRSMQPTVEDVPESPDSLQHSFRRSANRPPPQQQHFDPEYEPSASPAPLHLSGRRSSGLAQYESSSLVSRHQHQRRHPSRDFDYDEPPRGTPPRDLSNQSQASFSSYNNGGGGSSHGGMKALTYHNDYDADMGASSGGGRSHNPPPFVPASLVPGMDPTIAQEITERFNQDRHHRRRYTQPAPIEPPPRGRTMSDLASHYDMDASSSAYETNAGAMVTTSHSRSPVPMSYSGGPTTPNNPHHRRDPSPNPYHRRDPSPNPMPPTNTAIATTPTNRHTIKRKSVSPAPPPSQATDSGRRLSGMPFGPDSYDALNPSVTALATREPATTRADYNEVSGKIITHDGREVDPSDHLPVESWAPEPEPKKPSAGAGLSGSGSGSGSAVVSASSTPPTTTGRRQLRIALRPQSMAALPASASAPAGVITYDDGHSSPTPLPPSAGRNRLQKKGQGQTQGQRSTVVVSTSTPPRGRAPSGGGSPLAALPAHQDHNYTPPRGISRASTFDYVGSGGENYAPPPSQPPMYGSSPGRGDGGSPGYGSAVQGGRGDFGGRGPPLPAKVPLALPAPGDEYEGALVMSGALPADDGWGRDGGYAGYGGGGGGGYGSRGGGSGGGDPFGGGQLSLMEEMQRIDIGSGRSRRHGSGY